MANQKTHDAIKSSLFSEFGRIGKAVANPHRLELLDLLAQGERTVEGLASASGRPIKSTSAHLRELRSARLVATRRQGTYIFYRLAGPAVADFLRTLQNLGRKYLAEVDRLVRDYYTDPADLKGVGVEELLERARSGAAVVLDVRPLEEYQAGHLPGAVSIPVGDLERRLSELPSDREIVAYCRGPYCLYSVEAVSALRDAGYRARRLELGPTEWHAQGVDIERGKGAARVRGADIGAAPQTADG